MLLFSLTANIQHVTIKKKQTKSLDCNMSKKTDTDLKFVSSCLNENKIATMDQLKTLLGANSRMTVFRKLAKTEYLSSCSHSGK